MYNPFGGNKFPYTNFHELNLDWIIEIAKNFLDQYTHIQETIDTGLEELDTKYETLSGLLQSWYDTHSEDIANQLAEAIQDLDEWYSTHQDYLDQTLQDNEDAFDAHADAKAATTIASIPDDYSTFSANAVKAYRTVFNSTNVVSPYNDLDTLPWNNIYVYLGSGAALVAHAPTTRWFTVMTYCYDPTGNGVSGVQIATGVGHEAANRTWIRAKLGENSWGSWREIASADMFVNYIKSNTTVFTNSNVTSPYNDLNTLPMNEIVVYLESATASVSNKPTTFWFTVMTFCYDPTGNGVSAAQIAFQIGGPEAVPKAGTMFTRVKTGTSTWTPWMIMDYNRNFYVSASGFYEGHEAFTTFRAGLEAAMEHEYATLYINSGEYDLVTEYADLIASYQGGDNWCGPLVGKNITLIGNRNTKLKFRYTGTNDYIKQDFSPINIGGNATLKNLMIDVENCRYCVHEDMNTVYNFNPPVGHLKTEYINCEMLHRGTNGSYNAPFCIGRGDTGNSIMIVEGGYYHADNSRHITIFSHNGGSTQNPLGNSYIMIKDIIQGDKQDRFRFTAPNQNSVFISICNSLLGYPDIDYGEDAELKMRVTQWNNSYQH